MFCKVLPALSNGTASEGKQLPKETQLTHGHKASPSPSHEGTALLPGSETAEDQVATNAALLSLSSNKQAHLLHGHSLTLVGTDCLFFPPCIRNLAPASGGWSWECLTSLTLTQRVFQEETEQQPCYGVCTNEATQGGCAALSTAHHQVSTSDWQQTEEPFLGQNHSIATT